MDSEACDIRDADLIRRADKLMESDLDDERIIMEVTTGRLYGMEQVAREIWKATETPIQFGDLLDRLTDQYDVDRATCSKDVAKFLQALRESNLIDVVSNHP